MRKPNDIIYALPYSSLQEIHVMIGMVYGSKMNLPTRMIAKAKQVHSLMLNLKTIHPNDQANIGDIQVDALEHATQLLTANADSPERGFNAVYGLMLKLQNSKS